MGALDYREYYTKADFVKWEGDWELIDGMAYAMAPSPLVTHQNIMVKIAAQLDNAVSECENCLVLAETDYEVSEDTILRPDILLICSEINEHVDRTPELIFEILSPSTARRDETIKFEIYRREGVPYYILIDPERLRAKVYHLSDSGQYVKVGDFTKERYRFELEHCVIDFDFSKIWRKQA
jgi:Uma2 family endonuclease